MLIYMRNDIKIKTEVAEPEQKEQKHCGLQICR